MKTLFIIIFALFPFLSRAQTDAATIDVKANVLSSIQITNEQNLDFGDVLAGETTTIPVDHANAGKFFVSSNNRNTPFQVTWTFPSQLTHEHSEIPDVIDLTLIFAGSDETNGPINIASIEDGDTFNTGPARGAPFDQVLKTVYVGGTINIPEETAGGLYSGELTVTVEVN